MSEGGESQRVEAASVEHAAPQESGRREFLTFVGAGAAGLVLGACGKCTSLERAGGSASSAAQTAAVLPAHVPLELLPPDIPGGDGVPAGYLKYPSSVLKSVVREKPGQGGPPISTMSPVWGPAPPGLGNNRYLDAINRALGVTVNPSVQDGLTYAQKLSALLGARDVPDVLCVPSWEVDKVPRFTQAVKALFTDLTEHLQGESVHRYPLLATIPTASWRYCVWGGRLAAVPYPTDGVFPWAMFYRRDITTARGVPLPTNIDEFYRFGKALTKPNENLWAFGDTFEMVQMYYGCPGVQGGWRKKPSGGLEHKYELPEYEEAVAFTARLYRDGLVHPDLVASSGADAYQLFKSGRIAVMRDGMGGWYSLQRDQAKITPGFDMQPLPIFSASGGEPLAWGSSAPIFYTFVKKGLGKPRTQEILGVLDWCAAPFGSAEYETNLYGVEGVHFTRAPDRSPIATPLGQKELGNQYRLLGGRVPVVVGSSEVPTYVKDLLDYTHRTVKHREEDFFAGIKLEMPATYSKTVIATEDKIKDLVRGRRPLSDLRGIVSEWRRSTGDETRGFLEKVLTENGR